MLTKIRKRLKVANLSKEFPAARVRWLGVAAMTALMVATTLSVLGAALWGWTFGLGQADLPTRINTVAAVCAFVLVAATLFVALIAYLAATGRPDLQVRVTVRGSEPDKPVFRVIPAPTTEYPDRLRISAGKDGAGSVCVVRLANRSRYSARNPGARIYQLAMEDLKPQEGWTTPDDKGGMIQWDGGADLLIHGVWQRDLPAYDFDGALVYFPTLLKAVSVTVAADGVRPTTHPVPVRLMNPDEYLAYKRQLLNDRLASFGAAADIDHAD